jgi:hypothetical protein
MKKIFGSKRGHFPAKVCVFLIMAALAVGMTGYGGSCVVNPPSEAIEIQDWYDLDDIRDNRSDSYILVNDLDSTTAGYEELAGPTANLGKGWEPIGDWEYSGFSGTFDGQGYEIRDLFISRPEEDGVGLFGSIDDGAHIENTGVANAIVTGRRNVGGLVGLSGQQFHNTTVSNCYASGNISGQASIGGLVGVNRGTVTDCYSSSSVTGNVFVGGLVGGISYGAVSGSYATGSVTGLSVVGGLSGRNCGTVSNCYATGNITGDDNIGGLAGQNWGVDEASVNNSHSTGNVNGENHIGGLVGQSTSTVSHSYSTGGVSGNWCVGGLVGQSTSTVSHSYSTGDVSGDWCVGGLVGDNWGGTVSNSYSTSDVVGEISDVAGLVGFNTGNVSNSYSTGSMTGSKHVGGAVGNNQGNVSNSYSIGTVTGNEEVGGLVGGNYEGTASNSFWDIETSGQASSDGGTGKNTTEMKDITTFSGAGWIIVTVGGPGERNQVWFWNIVNNVTYPFLSWQP